MIIAHVDVLGAEAESQKPGKFKCLVFKPLCSICRAACRQGQICTSSFPYEFDEGNDVTKGHRHGYVLGFGC